MELKKFGLEIQPWKKKFVSPYNTDLNRKSYR